MRQIARQAGVGEPTLRRRFSSKEELIAEAFEDKVKTYADLAEQALGASDSSRGFREFLDAVMDMQLTDLGFAEVLTMTFPPTMRSEQHRRQSYEFIEALIAKAQDEGSLRRDFTAEDIVLMLLAHAGIAGGSGKLSKPFSYRFRAYVFDALGISVGTPLPPSPSSGRVYHSLLQLHDAS